MWNSPTWMEKKPAYLDFRKSSPQEAWILKHPALRYPPMGGILENPSLRIWIFEESRPLELWISEILTLRRAVVFQKSRAVETWIFKNSESEAIFMTYR